MVIGLCIQLKDLKQLKLIYLSADLTQLNLQTYGVAELQKSLKGYDCFLWWEERPAAPFKNLQL